VEVPSEQVQLILRRLGFGVESREGGGWTVAVPHWRMLDTTRPIDLVEEIGRVYGLERIPARLPARREALGGLAPMQRLQRTLEDAAAGLGLHETVTYSLVGTGGNERAGADPAEVLALRNPMTAEHAELRTSIVASMLEVIHHNRAAGNEDVALFELTRTFSRVPADHVGADGLPRFARETRVLQFACAGALHGGRYDAAAIPADFASAAGIADALLDAAGVRAARRVPAAAPPSLHPGQAAELVAADGTVVGWVGTVHPSLVRDFHIKGVVVSGMLDLEAINSVIGPIQTYTAVSSFPPVRNDIALLLADGVEASAVERTVWAAAGELLESVEVFDRYTGEQVPDGQYSLALRLTFRAADRTLTDDEVAAVRRTVVERVRDEMGAVLRDS
jgi:phenylalanyl-tRNA synthetase beta chain